MLISCSTRWLISNGLSTTSGTMGAHIRLMMRIWGVMFAAYVLLLQSVLPIYAFDPEQSGSLFGYICQRSVSDDGSGGAAPSHADACCILCVAPGLAAAAVDPVREALPVRQAVLVADFIGYAFQPRAPPELHGIQSRAPPRLV
ncbi:DUF2946 family protein [Hartmannibacter diazotrophicus]